MTAAVQIPLNFPINPAMGRDDFLVADSNRDALDWIDRSPYWNAPVLYIHGPAGSGKTHLANIWHAQNKTGHVIDNLDDVLGNRTSEENLFHLYNRVRQTPGSILITGSKPLSLMQFTIPDLASRLRAAPQIGITLPDEDLLRALLVKLFADRQMRIDVSLIEYMIPRMERSFSAARELVAELDHTSLTQKRPPNIGMLRRLLMPEQDVLFADE